MKARTVGLVAMALLVLTLGAAFVYGESRDDVVADGVSVAGVDLGGMDRGEARAALERRLAPAVSRPVTAAYKSRRYTLSEADGRIRLDAQGVVAEALDRSGGPFARALRDAMGGEADVRLPARVTYSRPALQRFVAHVERAINRPERDADVGFAGGRLHRVHARNGLRVLTPRLERALERALASPSPKGRVVTVPARVIERPDVTLDELARRYPRVLTVDRKRKRLRFYRGLRLVGNYPIAVGQAGDDTPAGRYKIRDKQVDPAWHAPEKEWAGELAGQTVPPGDPQNPLKARWMEFHDGAGIHGTDDIASLGESASHGCIRMSIREVKQLYRRVRVGTPLFID